MTDPKEPVRIEDEDGRAARTPGTLRYILGISLAMAIIAMSLVWIVPALTR